MRGIYITEFSYNTIISNNIIIAGSTYAIFLYDCSNGNIIVSDWILQLIIRFQEIQSMIFLILALVLSSGAHLLAMKKRKKNE